jgi:hypothetical protein
VLKRGETAGKVDAVMLEHGQVIGAVQNIPAFVGMLIVCARERQNGRRNIDSIHLIKVRNQCLRRSAEAAPEIHRPVFSQGEAQGRNERHHIRGVGSPEGEKIFHF